MVAAFEAMGLTKQVMSNHLLSSKWLLAFWAKIKLLAWLAITLGEEGLG